MTQGARGAETLDTSDVDKYVGQSVGGGQMKEPVTVTDIRRWVQAMNYPNARHYDEDAAAKTQFGEIVAPQSFALACDAGHGTIPAIVGKIPGSHMIFGGDEWWFYGPTIRPGDRIRMERRFHDYKVANTKFAGPTMFSRGDTTYVNQRKEAVAKQRSTAVRYRADLAQASGYYEQNAPVPTFSEAQLAEIRRQQREWVASGADGAGPVKIHVGDKLPPRPIGPHTISGFITEVRAFNFTVWGSHVMEGQYFGADAGWLPELSGTDGDGSDSAMSMGPEEGPASGHTNLEKAKLIGLPRAYGYGSSMGTWVLDYLAYWAGDRGFIRHANIEYRFPVFEDDLAVLHAEVAEQRHEPILGVDLVAVDIRMVNQDDVLLARGRAEIEVPSG